MGEIRGVITQPDLFPWLGAFDKMKKCDVFVFLDHVTNRPADGLWTKRVKLLINKEPKWLTVPLKKDKTREVVPINEMVIDFDGQTNLQQQHLSTIRLNYAKAPFFYEIFPFIEEYYQLNETGIAKRNQWFIESVGGKLDILRPTFTSSALFCTKKSNELLIEICEKLTIKKYIYGEGSINYLNPAVWQDHAIELVPQQFIHPVYSHFNTGGFYPGLSIIDVLMNNGFKNTSNLLK